MLLLYVYNTPRCSTVLTAVWRVHDMLLLAVVHADSSSSLMSLRRQFRTSDDGMRGMPRRRPDIRARLGRAAPQVVHAPRQLLLLCWRFGARLVSFRLGSARVAATTDETFSRQNYGTKIMLRSRS